MNTHAELKTVALGFFSIFRHTFHQISLKLFSCFLLLWRMHLVYKGKNQLDLDFINTFQCLFLFITFQFSIFLVHQTKCDFRFIRKSDYFCLWHFRCSLKSMKKSLYPFYRFEPNLPSTTVPLLFLILSAAPHGHTYPNMPHPLTLAVCLPRSPSHVSSSAGAWSPTHSTLTCLDRGEGKIV